MTASDWKIRQGAQVLVVTGMHRSGTSMLTRLASLMGVALGDHLVPPLPDNNETGFWEHEHLVTLHEELLEHYASWHLGLADLPAHYLNLPVAREYQRKIQGILRRDFAHETCWGVKDPRISRLVPLWKDTLEGIGAEPVWMIAVRSPAEVAASLVVRNGISRERALLLWLKYNLEVEFHTRGQRRAFVHYPDLLTDWQTSLRRAAELTGFHWPRDYAEVAGEAARFIRPDLRHQKETDLADVPAWMARAYDVLREASQSSTGEADATALDSIRAEFQGFNAPMQEEISGLRRAIAGQTRDIEDLQRHLRLIFGSFSWRLTKPVRAARKGAKWITGRPGAQA